MKAIVINQKVVLVRHWLRWYKVQRGAEDWRPLKIGRYVKEQKFDVEKVAKSLNAKYPTLKPLPLPDILNEAVADKHVKKNTPKRKA